MNREAMIQRSDGEGRELARLKGVIWGILAVVGGFASAGAIPWLLGAWVDLGWRRPVQDWMTSVGLAGLVGHFGLLYILVPDYGLAILGGVVIGLVAWRRWVLLSLLYSGTLFGIPCFSDIGTADNIPDSFKGWTFVELILQNAAVIPLALVAAWLASMPFRRRAARIAASLCASCGYDLTGNVTGVCSECGEPIQDAKAVSS